MVETGNSVIWTPDVCIWVIACWISVAMKTNKSVTDEWMNVPATENTENQLRWLHSNYYNVFSALFKVKDIYIHTVLTFWQSQLLNPSVWQTAGSEVFACQWLSMAPAL